MNRQGWSCVRLFCVAFVVALSSSAALAASIVPFRATIGFAEQVAPSTDPAEHCALIGTIGGGGTSTPLGPLQLTSRDCINPLSATSFLFVSDEVVLHLATGELIYAAYGGTLSLTDGVVRGSYFIYGGTGRFKRAGGVGTISGVEGLDPTTGAGGGQIELTGTLVY